MKYQDLVIENFRGIEKLEIADLKTINLLVGRNNCGKTSVLEALFLLSGMSNPQLPVSIHNFRDLILTGDDGFSFMFNGLNFTIPIIISGTLDKQKRKLTINPKYADYSPKEVVKQNRKVSQPATSSVTLQATTSLDPIVDGLELKFQESQNQFDATISLKGNVHLDNKYKEVLSCSFINSGTFMSQLDKHIEDLLVHKKLGSLISVLQGIEPNLTDIRIGSAGMIWVDIGGKKLLPLNIMGDGMRRVLSIISIISSTKNGVVLIDEVENGLHYSALSVLWKAIFTACKEYQVQLIATTHSYECIEALSKAYAEIEPEGDDVRLYRIDRTENKHKAFVFNTEVLKAGIEKSFEMR